MAQVGSAFSNLETFGAKCGRKSIELPFIYDELNMIMTVQQRIISMITTSLILSYFKMRLLTNIYSTKVFKGNKCGKYGIPLTMHYLLHIE